MKAVFIFNFKNQKLTSFTYPGPGPLPPFVEPENPDEPKDCKPAEPGPRKRRRRKERPS